MAFIYFNQNNYKSTPYPSPNLPKATVASGGCGVVCASMIVSNLTDKVVDPVAMAKYAIANKSRVSGGTDMNALSQALCRDYPLSFTTTNDENVLVEHLKSGGMAIANVGGDRAGYVGVFSDGGHYIVCAGMVGNTKVICYDPGLYAGKFNREGRYGKVSVSGNECLCSLTVLGADTANRSPAYWLFKRREEMIPDWVKKIMEKARAIGLISADHNPNEPATKWFVLITILRAIEYIKTGKITE